MAAGRKPKSTLLRILEGNPSKRPLPELEPACDLPPVKPLTVSDDPRASAEWDRVIAAMPPGLYTALDVAVLAMYASAWSMFWGAQEEIDRNGFTVPTKEGVKTNPAVTVWKGASDTIMKCADRLGLAPGVRSRLQVPSRDKKSQSKFDGLIG